MRLVGHVAGMGKMTKCIQSVGQKTWWKESLGRPRRRWDDSIRMYQVQYLHWNCFPSPNLYNRNTV